MANVLRICIGALLAVGVAAADEEGPINEAQTEVVDATITARVETLYLMNEHLNPFRINTTTRNGVVSLQGEVDDEIERDLAEDLARSIEDVQEVDNQLQIDPNDEHEHEQIDADRRERAERIRAGTTEANLKAAVRSRLAYDDSLDGANIEVDVEGDTVILSGAVASEEQLKDALYVARNTRGVGEVEEDLRLAEPGEDLDVADADAGEDGELEEAERDVERAGDDLGDAFERVGENISDAWVEKRVELAIAFNEHVSMRGLDVEVRDGVCIITGTTLTEQQKELVERIAHRTDGVESVENNIEIDTEPLERASRDAERGDA